jgi:hypothetical protein
MKIPKLDNLYIIPDEVIESCAEEMHYDENNNFLLLISEYKKYEEAGLNPVFLTNDMETIYVSTFERLKKTLH